MREWLRSARTEKGLKEMGDRLGISESYYCAIENGARQKRMDFALVAALSSILGIPIDTIARRESEWAGRPAS